MTSLTCDRWRHLHGTYRCGVTAVVIPVEAAAAVDVAAADVAAVDILTMAATPAPATITPPTAAASATVFILTGGVIPGVTEEVSFSETKSTRLCQLVSFKIAYLENLFEIRSTDCC